MEGLDVLYRHRLSAAEIKAKDAVWRVFCEEFLGAPHPADGHSAGDRLRLRRVHPCHPRRSEARRRSKLRRRFFPAAGAGVPPGGRRKSDFVAEGTVDVCFTSNFFEHLLSKAVMDAVLAETIRALKPGGRLMALQPNLRYVAGRYWGFYDHHLPLTHLSCGEAIAKAGFEIQELIPKFLPYSTKSALPKHPVLVRAYLRLPLAWHFLGRQFFIVGPQASALNRRALALMSSS
jgi:SAM-dependent methyltransferase